MNDNKPTIAIMEENIPAHYERMHINKLLFLPDNPRVYAGIREMLDFDDLTNDEKQLRIYDHLLKEPSVKNLVPEIRKDGGLQDPIIVRYDTLEVIEGNSRLAAYRKLHDDDDDDDRWAHIECHVVKTLTDDQQTRLLGQTHLRGKTEWSPYAKALFCFRRRVEKKQDILALARLSGFTQAEIKKNVKTIQLMQENDDHTPSHFSYYGVLVRTRAISSAIENDRPLREKLLSQIQTEDLAAQNFTAQKMRERLPVIIKKPKILRKYVKGDVSFEEAYDRAKISGAEQRLKRILNRLDDIDREDIALLERNELKAVQQVTKRIDRSLKRVTGMIETQLAGKSINS